MGHPGKEGSGSHQPSELTEMAGERIVWGAGVRAAEAHGEEIFLFYESETGKKRWLL